jgi:predicted kinase
MRKWMRDRLKRRKKEPEAGATEAGPAPLQPAFYDNEVAKPSAAKTDSETVAVEPVELSGDSDASAPSTPMQADTLAGDVTRRRRRRGRGGRGRNRSGAARTDAGATPATGEAIATVPQAAEPVVQHAPVHSQAAPMARAAASNRPPTGAVILAIGLPGSGKSSWFKRHNINPLSSDLLRALLFDDANEQRYQELVFSNLRSMLKARLIAKRPLNYVDATNLTPHERQGWIKLAKDYGYEVQAVFFDVPLEVCLERHRKRDRVVAEDVMRRMAVKLKAPTFEEGFSKIIVVRVKRKEAEPA